MPTRSQLIAECQRYWRPGDPLSPFNLAELKKRLEELKAREAADPEAAGRAAYERATGDPK